MTTRAESIYAGLASVFEDVFPDAEVVPDPETRAGDVPGWDSLGQVALIVAVEDYFDIEFTDEEYAEFDSVPGLVALIEAKLG